MKTSSLRIAAGFALASLPILGTARAAEPPVAVVYELAGEASRSFAGAPPKALHPYDWLPARTILKAAPGTRLALAFVGGRRYRLTGPAQATLGTRELSGRSGGVLPLPSLPPFPRLPPIARGDRPGATAGALRLRHPGIEIRSPPDGGAAIAGAARLDFRSQGGAPPYRVEVEDARGNVVFARLAEASPVEVPPGILQPGRPYHWSVEETGRTGAKARGEADFLTLSRRQAGARERLRQAIERLGDDGARTLLEAVDRALGLVGAETEAATEVPGVVVESLGRKSGGEAAGLLPGDRIVTWSCPPAPAGSARPQEGRIGSPYDLRTLEVERAPLCPVTLQGWRAAEAKAWTLPLSDWAIVVRPGLAAETERLYQAASAQITAGDAAGAERSWRQAVETERAAGRPLVAAWLLERQAKALDQAGKAAEADVAFAQAVAVLEGDSHLPASAFLLRIWGTSLLRRGAWDAAMERFQSALTHDRRAAPKSLSAAMTFDAMGTVAGRRGDFSTAERYLREGLALREELAPGSTVVTWSFNNLGIVARHQGDLAKAEAYYTQAEALLRRLAPGSSDLALFQQNLANLAVARGDPERAESLFRQALSIFVEQAPGEDGAGDCLQSLATIAMHRGDLTVAEDLLRRFLTVEERRAPSALRSAEARVSLGVLAYRQGDLETAESHYLQALAIQERLAPEDPPIATTLSNLGAVATFLGDFARARSYLQRALALKEKAAPGSSNVAISLENLGRLEMESGGDLEAAEALLRRALSLFEQEDPEGLWAADTVRDLGELAVRRGRLPEALALHRRSLDLQHRLAPGTLGEAERLHLLGLTEQEAGHAREGADDLCRAIDVLDQQRARVGETQEVRSTFEKGLGTFYFHCLDGRLRQGRLAEAFQSLERGRARTFLSLLAERDLRFADLPPELAAERKRIDREYDRVQAELAQLRAGRDDAEIESQTEALRRLRAEQEAIVGRLRRESPRAAALQAPQPLDLTAARAALDPGTALLEYAVGEEKTWLFVLTPTGGRGSGVAVFPIALGATRLREEVEAFRRLLGRPGSDRAALLARAGRLYDLLVRPAEGRLRHARRLLVSPDGPLHTLAFAALRRGPRYLVEWKPVHSVLSATVYAELRRSRPARPPAEAGSLAAFGAPIYPAAGSKGQATPEPADPQVRRALRGFALQPLPASRREIEGIAALYPGAKAFLGAEATEENAKAASGRARLLHFACHGLLDPRSPLDSALALTLPEHPGEGRDNGLLQAWEIFEGLRLDADLVTLSACDTALGQESGGEGLVGLTRAFQYAGARSVVASLWSLNDASAATFMKRFYGYLRAGRPKDEALRAAQRDQIHEAAGASHPFYWATFELFGDWR